MPRWNEGVPTGVPNGVPAIGVWYTGVATGVPGVPGVPGEPKLGLAPTLRDRLLLGRRCGVPFSRPRFLVGVRREPALGDVCGNGVDTPANSNLTSNAHPKQTDYVKECKIVKAHIHSKPCERMQNRRSLHPKQTM